MKRRICMILALVLLVCLGMTACAGDGKNPAMDYTLVNKDGQYMMVFDDISKYQEEGSYGSELNSISFPSMQDFKDAVTKGTLTESDKRTIAVTFPKNDSGAVLVCDFDNLYQPKIPADGTAKTVTWYGPRYSVYIDFGNDKHAFVSITTQEIYRERYLEDYKNYFSTNENITVTDRQKLPDGKTAIYYYTSIAELKRIRFSWTEGDKTVHVDKKYTLKNDGSMGFDGVPSDTIPRSVFMYCEEGDLRYIINLHELTEDPTDEWLMEFGIEKFVDNGDAEK